LESLVLKILVLIRCYNITLSSRCLTEQLSDHEHLVYDAGPNGKRGGDTPISKTTPSGSQTPAPTSKVLRWKDLKSAAAEAGRFIIEHLK
jgi:hypothetical protein